MNKKGQITLFVILGVVIIGALALGFYFRQQIATKEVREEAAELTGLPPDVDTLREEVEDCAKQVSDEALYFVGRQGGYFLAPDDSIVVGDDSVAFGVQNNAKTLVSEETFKNEISSYVNAFLPECVDYGSYPDLEIFDQNPVTDVDFGNEKAALDIEYKVTVQKDGNTYNLFEPYEVELPLRVKKVYESSSKIADDIAANQEDFDVAKIASYGTDVDVYHVGDGFLIVNVRDVKQEQNYDFQFGVAL